MKESFERVGKRKDEAAFEGFVTEEETTREHNTYEKLRVSSILYILPHRKQSALSNSMGNQVLGKYLTLPARTNDRTDELDRLLRLPCKQKWGTHNGVRPLGTEHLASHKAREYQHSRQNARTHTR